MENVMKMTKGVRALAILVLLLVVPAGEVAFGHGGGVYRGYYQASCLGNPYLVTTNSATIRSEAASGRLLSYSFGGICYTASAAP